MDDVSEEERGFDMAREYVACAAIYPPAEPHMAREHLATLLQQSLEHERNSDLRHLVRPHRATHTP